MLDVFGRLVAAWAGWQTVFLPVVLILMTAAPQRLEAGLSNPQLEPDLRPLVSLLMAVKIILKTCTLIDPVVQSKLRLG